MLSTLVHRSVFGEVIDEARHFPEGPGFGFSRNTRPLVEKVDFGLNQLLLQIKYAPAGFIESLEQVRTLAQNAAGLLQVLVDNPIDGSFLFQRNPKQEIPKMVDLLFDAKFNSDRVPIKAPVCPDYEPGTYQLRGGIGETATKVLETYPYIRQLYAKYGFQTKLRIDVADVEAFDEAILQASHETTDSFLKKVDRTKTMIGLQTALSGDIDVGTMGESFRQNGFDYHRAQERNAHAILEARDGVRAKVRESLIVERLKSGDLTGVPGVLAKSLISSELGGYAAYGESVGGSAIILSPDAMSAIPAYHFGIFRDDEFSPVIYLRNSPKEGR